METKQMNRLAMFRNTRAVLAGLPTTRDIPTLPDRLTAFDAKMDEIETLEAQQAAPLSPQLTARNAAFTDMVDSVLALAGIVLSHAKANGLASLASVVRLKPSDFSKTRYDRRVLLVQHVLDAVRDALPQLADAGVTAATLDAVQAKIDAANAQLIVPRDTVVSKRAATERLAVAFTEAGDMLAEWIDPLLVPLAKTDPEFYARYQAAREIVDRPATRASPPADNAIATPAANSATVTPAPIKMAA